jgi:hypothetical protein
MKTFAFIFLCSLSSAVFCQNTTIGDFTRDESIFYAQTKQVNQFFRRFNGEEDVRGKRFYNKDSTYRDLKSRKKFLYILFDNSNGMITNTEKNDFIELVTNKKNPVFLDFHGNSWFAEVATSFTYKKEKVNIILYLKLEHQNLGYKWDFSNVYFTNFNEYFSHINDTSNVKLFLHPLSHEIDFMNIHKVFEDPGNIDYYLEKKYMPDHLALFVSEVKNGNLKFDLVKSVKFHFFQVPGWYFEVSYFNRNEENSGWLISNMIRINAKDKKDLIRNYTHDN